MYHIKNDQRAIRVSQMLVDALVVLMGQKKFDQIKVSDLVKEAGVGRATFYRNFDMIEDVLRMRCDQTIDGLMTYIMSYRQTHKIEHGRQL
ncbi:MAG: helix-turn-helix domain-containing protein, partial [Ardenticatenaceae bacterium]